MSLKDEFPCVRVYLQIKLHICKWPFIAFIKLSVHELLLSGSLGATADCNQVISAQRGGTGSTGLSWQLQYLNASRESESVEPDIRDMFTVRVGRRKMPRQKFRSLLKILMVLVPVVVVSMLILQQYNNPFISEWRRALYVDVDVDESSRTSEKLPKDTDGGCFMDTHCPDDHFSFYMKSGAENVMGPKICIQNKVVLGMMLNNVGQGLNIVIMNGETGNITKTGHFNMYNNEVEPLIEFLKSIEQGSIVLIASWDEPSSHLNDEAKQLMADLGSSAVHSLGFRDNWLFVGGKGVTVMRNFEKHLKNDNKLDETDNWPEQLELEGCIPRYMNWSSVSASRNI